MTDSFDDPTDDATHRGGFGEFAGEATGLIDRSFREQIVLVGVQLPGASDAVSYTHLTLPTSDLV